MADINEEIFKLLEMDIVGEDNSVSFSEEAKRLIHEITIRCSKAKITKENEERSCEYKKNLSAEDVYVDMLHKIVTAPTSLHMLASARMLIPIIDEKIRNGETGFRNKGKKKGEGRKRCDDAC